MSRTIRLPGIRRLLPCVLVAGPVAVASIGFLQPAAVRGDVVRLKSGGEVRGMVVSAPDNVGSGKAADDNGEAGRPADEHDEGIVVVETLSGGTVSVSAIDVQFITRRPRVFEEHDRKAALARDTVEDHWELAEWCREHFLEEQRIGHLERIVELETNHADARRALGQVEHNGVWMSRDEVMKERGLVRHRNRWITRQELELIEKTASERDREQKWFADVKGMKARLRGPSESARVEAWRELTAIRDPHAIPALANYFDNDPDPETRRMYVGVLAALSREKPAGTKAAEPLVKQLLHDVDRNVRRAALEAIDEPLYDAVLPYLVQGLKDKQNEVVRRAGAGLEKVGDMRAVPALMKALITTHKYQVAVPDNSSSYSFGSDGSFSMGGSGGTPLPPEIAVGLRTGAYPNGINVNDSRPQRTRMATVSVNQENPEVLAALEAITGEKFGFDERSWRLWWAAQKGGFG